MEFWPFAPDLAIEIASPSDRPEAVNDKVREYLDPSTRLVWVAWPTSRSITAYEPSLPRRELGPDDEIDGGDVLPGFRVRVSEL